MRYPTLPNGRIVPVTELGFADVSPQRKVTNNHHYWYDKAWYQDKRYRQVFRGLLPHVVPLLFSEHDQLHERFSAPIMPRDSLMIEVIDEYLSLNGVIDVVREHRTCETYQIMPAEWRAIRSGYGKTIHRT